VVVGAEADPVDSPDDLMEQVSAWTAREDRSSPR
jgi:hypothetical protein